MKDIRVGTIHYEAPFGVASSRLEIPTLNVASAKMGSWVHVGLAGWQPMKQLIFFSWVDKMDWW